VIQQPFRIDPAGPVHAYQTFQIHRPRGPEFERPATCEEVGCEAWTNGWITRVPTGSDLANAVRTSGRTPSAITMNADGTTSFAFGAGTPCFRASAHRRPVRPDIPDLFVVRDGDWRGNPSGRRMVHQRPDDWVEHFQEATDQAVSQIQRG
jgi:hypothetical protein